MYQQYNSRSNGECLTNSNDHHNRIDDVLFRRKCELGRSKCTSRNDVLLPMELGRNGNQWSNKFKLHSKCSRKLHIDSNQQQRMYSNKYSDSSNGECLTNGSGNHRNDIRMCRIKRKLIEHNNRRNMVKFKYSDSDC